MRPDLICGRDSSLSPEGERDSGLPPRFWCGRPRSDARSWPCRLFLKREFTEVGDDDICAMRSEVDGMIASSNANHKSEPAGPSCFHADKGIFEDDGARR